jgi:hypothetical protein
MPKETFTSVVVVRVVVLTEVAVWVAPVVLCGVEVMLEVVVSVPVVFVMVEQVQGHMFANSAQLADQHHAGSQLVVLTVTDTCVVVTEVSVAHRQGHCSGTNSTVQSAYAQVGGSQVTVSVVVDSDVEMVVVLVALDVSVCVVQ